MNKYSSFILKTKKIVSFDIFDTCICRACGKPENLFYLLAIKILGTTDESSIEEFIKIRKRGEKLARQNSQNEEITIDDIYKNCDFNKLTLSRKAHIKKEEINLELQQSLRVEDIVYLIKLYRQHGKRIIFISDMYLPDYIIKKILLNTKIWEEGDKLYVSCETRFSKYTGSLFKYIKKVENISFKEWIHYGDNNISDYRIPKKLGIKCKLIRNNYDTKNKNFILNCNSIKLLNIDILKSSIKKCSTTTKDKDFFIDLALLFFTSFVYKVFTYCEKKGIKKLVFLSRDGYLPYYIAKSFQNYIFNNIEIKYLLVSRSTLYPNELSFKSINQFKSFILEYLNNTRGKGDISDILPYNIIEKFFSKKKESPIFKINNIEFENIIELIREHNELLIEYLKKKDFFNKNKKTAIVDLRGTGKCISILSNLQIEKGCKIPSKILIDIVRNQTSKNCDEFKIFNESTTHDTYYNQLADIIENVFALAPHKRVVGYYKKNYIIKPLFDNYVLPSEIKSIIINRKNIIKKFVKYYYLNGYYHYSDFYFNSSISVLKDFSIYPDIKFLKYLSIFIINEKKRKPVVGNLFRMSSYKNKVIWYRGSLFYTFRNRYIIKLIERILDWIYGRK